MGKKLQHVNSAIWLGSGFIHSDHQFLQGTEYLKRRSPPFQWKDELTFISYGKI